MKPAILALTIALASAPVLLLCGVGVAQSPPVPEPSDSLALPPAVNESSSESVPGPGEGPYHELHATCPMVVEDVNVVVTDIDGGISLTFMTGAPHIADLQTRVHSMARMYQVHQGQGPLMWQDMTGNGRGRGLGLGMGMGWGLGAGHMDGSDPLPAVTVSVTDTDNGARLDLWPVDPSQLISLREHIRWHHLRMSSGECWMLAQLPVSSDVEVGP